MWDPFADDNKLNSGSNSGFSKQTANNYNMNFMNSSNFSNQNFDQQQTNSIYSSQGSNNFATNFFSSGTTNQATFSTFNGFLPAQTVFDDDSANTGVLQSNFRPNFQKASGNSDNSDFLSLDEVLSSTASPQPLSKQSSVPRMINPNLTIDTTLNPNDTKLNVPEPPLPSKPTSLLQQSQPTIPAKPITSQIQPALPQKSNIAPASDPITSTQSFSKPNLPPKSNPSDSEELKLLCKVCNQMINAIEIAQHSKTCQAKVAAPQKISVRPVTEILMSSQSQAPTTYRVKISEIEKPQGNLNYKVTTASFDGKMMTVDRKQSDFEWLFEQLGEEFPECLIPPLPERSEKGILLFFDVDIPFGEIWFLQIWFSPHGCHFFDVLFFCFSPKRLSMKSIFKFSAEIWIAF